PTWEDERAAITLEDLLHMTSGLAWDETYDLGTAITEMLYLQPDMGAFAADQPLDHQIGTYQEYSSGTTNIICDVLHQRSGMGAEMAHELVFRPLGMASAVLEPDAAGDLVCSSYLWATPRDWARFGLLFAQDGRWDGQQLLPPGWVQQATTPRDVAGEEEGHAAHWWVNTRLDGSSAMGEVPADTFWASGHDGQRLFVIPSAGLVVVRMGFTPDIPSGELGYEAFLTDVLEAVGR
ncbi:MAG TPA: serine hydrolase, partial [Euzebya sp.]|nr:serine hydrolase [Euzebya sp.]